MKAAVHYKYGAPEVVNIKDVPKPTPASNEILIKVRATTVNRTDSGFRSAEYVISRLFSGLLKPKHNILGNEFAGDVEAIGKDVTLFNVGDKVFGYDDQRFGAHAEYKVITEGAAITTMPRNATYAQAAAICEGAHYALCDIRAAKVTNSHNVMVYGATGAIGSAAVQLIKNIGANVTAVCNTKNVALVKSLGADVVVDYMTQDFTQTSQRFDFIFDAVGKSSYGQCKSLLTSKGIYISTELGKNGENIWLALTTPFWGGGKKLLFPIPSISKDDVVFLKELVENGKFMPVIDSQHKLDNIVAVYQYVESAQKTGNVVITFD